MMARDVEAPVCETRQLLLPPLDDVIFAKISVLQFFRQNCFPDVSKLYVLCYHHLKHFT